MPKITTPLLVEDFYRTALSLDVNPSGDIELTVTAPPANTKGFIIVDPESEANRERMYYHDVIGNVIYVKGVNRVDPKEHFALDKVQINDTSLIFNYLSRLQSTTFYIEQLAALDINVWGGPVLQGIETISVTDTLLTVIDAATNYIYYKPSTNEIKTAIAEATVTTDKGIIVADVVAASGSITSISYRKNGLTTGISIDTVTLTGTVGLIDTYTILFTDGTSSTFDVTNGSNIASIDYTSSLLNVDTYTVTLTNGGTTTFEVTNGTSIVSVVKTGTVGLVDTYTITLTDDSTTNFEVTNGLDGLGVPSGGLTGEALVKKSNTNNDTEWKTVQLITYDYLKTIVALENIDENDSISISDFTPADNGTDFIDLFGSLASNLEVGFSIYIDSGTHSQLKLNLKTTASRTDDLSIRIETDNAGEPSGTLHDVNSYGTLDLSTTNTDVTEYTIPFNSSFVSGYSLVWVVLSVPSANNLASVGVNFSYKPNRGSLTGLIYNGTIWEDTNGLSVTSSDVVTEGYNNANDVASTTYFTPNKDIYLTRVSSATSGFTMKLREGTTILDQDLGTGAEHYFNLNIVLKSGVQYNLYLEGTNSSDSSSTALYPQTLTDVTINSSTGGINPNGNHGRLDLFVTKTVHGTENFHRILETDSDIVIGEGCFKTKADDGSKLNFKGFAISTQSAFNEITIHNKDLRGGFIGLTSGADYFLSDTAGEISLSGGTNKVKVGEARSSSDILIETDRGDFNLVYPVKKKSMQSFAKYISTVAPNSYIPSAGKVGYIMTADLGDTSDILRFNGINIGEFGYYSPSGMIQLAHPIMVKDTDEVTASAAGYVSGFEVDEDLEVIPISVSGIYTVPDGYRYVILHLYDGAAGSNDAVVSLYKIGGVTYIGAIEYNEFNADTAYDTENIVILHGGDEVIHASVKHYGYLLPEKCFA